MPSIWNHIIISCLALKIYLSMVVWICVIWICAYLNSQIWNLGYGLGSLDLEYRSQLIWTTFMVLFLSFLELDCLSLPFMYIMWKRVCEHSAKYLFFVPLKKVTVSNDMRVNTWWQNFYLWMNYPFKEVKYDQIMWIYFLFWVCWQPLPLLLELWSREQIWFCNIHRYDYKNHLKQVFQGMMI